jgi:hypothetical protein
LLNKNFNANISTSNTSTPTGKNINIHTQASRNASNYLPQDIIEKVLTNHIDNNAHIFKFKMPDYDSITEGVQKANESNDSGVNSLSSSDTKPTDTTNFSKSVIFIEKKKKHKKSNFPKISEKLESQM